MALKNVRYVKAKRLTNEQKKELGIEEAVPTDMIAIETYNPSHNLKGVIIKRGMVDYILNGNWLI